MNARRHLRPPLALAVAVCLWIPAAAQGEPAVGVVGGTVLAGFDTATPGTFTSLQPIGGLAPGERVQGLDFRHFPSPFVQPAPLPQLFALGVTPGDTLRLYTIDPGTGVATRVGAGEIAVAPAAGYGFDFNPSVDRIRVVGSAGENLRINPNNGARADFPSGDTDINTPADAEISGVAYDRVDVAPTVPPGPTTLYAISRSLSELGTIGSIDSSPQSPNSGDYTTVGSLGVTLDAGSTADFDITFGGAALATLTSGATQGLYAIDLATGAAALVGATAAPLNAFATLPATTVALGASAYAAGESAGKVTVTVVRGGSLSPTTTVAWSAGNGPQGAVGFARGETSRSFDVPIAADAIDEPDERTTVTLSSPSFPATLGTPATATLTIADDDPTPDTRTPGLRLSGVPPSISYARLLRRGVRATLTPSEPVTIEADLLATTRRARVSAFNTTLVSRELPLAAGARTVRLRPRRSALRRPRRSVNIRVQAVATDAAGNRAGVRKTLRLRRR